MKFARLLRATAFEGMPQMETLFSAYKSLKVRNYATVTCERQRATVTSCCCWGMLLMPRPPRGPFVCHNSITFRVQRDPAC